MSRIARPARYRTLGILIGCVLAACSEQPGAEAGASSEPTRTVVAAAAANGCPSASDVSAIVGLEFRDFPAGTQAVGDDFMCAYQAVDASNSLFVSLSGVGSAEYAEQTFSEMNESAELFLGNGSVAEAIPVGDRGYAYGSMSKTEAAAVAHGRLYRAEITDTEGGIDLTGKRAAMVSLVEKLITP